MTFVVTESCINCKYTDCVEVCPVDCFREGDNFLVIDPEECIDCALCEPECPVNAIKSEDDLGPDEKHFLDINKKFSKVWPTINTNKGGMQDCEAWRDVGDKLQYLDLSAISDL